MNCDVVIVSIGTLERAREFCDENELDRRIVHADPEANGHKKLALNSGVRRTLMDAETPKAILRRVNAGTIGRLASVLKEWKPWVPPKIDQSFQQGGSFVFKRVGEEVKCVYAFRDEATGANASINEILNATRTPW